MMALLRIALALAVLFALLIGLLHVQPVNRTIERTFGVCAMPCWQGIVPGQTRGATLPPEINGLNVPDCFAASRANCVAVFPILPHETNGYLQIRAIDGVIDEILVQYPDITLGEALLGFEQVQYSIYHTDRGVRSSSASGGHFYVWLRFAEARVSMITRVSCPATFSELMQTPVDTIILQPRVTSDLRADSFGDIRRTFGTLCAA